MNGLLLKELEFLNNEFSAAHPTTRTLFKVASYALPTSNDLLPMDRIVG